MHPAADSLLRVGGPLPLALLGTPFAVPGARPQACASPQPQFHARWPSPALWPPQAVDADRSFQLLAQIELQRCAGILHAAECAIYALLPECRPLTTLRIRRPRRRDAPAAAVDRIDSIFGGIIRIADCQ